MESKIIRQTVIHTDNILSSEIFISIEVTLHELTFSSTDNTLYRYKESGLNGVHVPGKSNPFFHVSLLVRSGMPVLGASAATGLRTAGVLAWLAHLYYTAAET